MTPDKRTVKTLKVEFKYIQWLAPILNEDFTARRNSYLIGYGFLVI